MNQLEPHELKRILNRLEEACHAAHQLMRIGEITREEYRKLNHAIWNIENKIKGDE